MNPDKRSAPTYYGDKILDAIISGKLVSATCAIDESHPTVITWSANVTEQLDALVRRFIEDVHLRIPR